MIRDFLVAISLANLWFIDIWRPFLIRHFTSYPYYHWKGNPAPILLATMLDVLALGLIIWLAVTLVRRTQSRLILSTARIVFVLVFLLVGLNFFLIILSNPPLNSLLSSLKGRPRLLIEWQGLTTIYYWFALFGVIVGWFGTALIAHSLIYRRERVLKLATTTLLIMSPFVLVTFSQATTQWLRYRTGEQFRESLAPRSHNERDSNRRVLWLIFDEMDFRLSFVDRPPSLHLPEFDRLLGEAIFASNAYPPGSDTETSLPAMINGRLVSSVSRSAPNELMVTFVDTGEIVPWSTQPNVFSQAREMSLNTGLVGWYHPYCRILGSSLTQCSWEPASLLVQRNPQLGSLISESKPISVSHSMLRVARTLLLTESVRTAVSGEDPNSWRWHILQEFKKIHAQSLKMATDPSLDLILAHYSVPHPPGFYDRSKRDFSFSTSSAYLDNLALADRVLGELREQMVEAGVWDGTTVLISSDHRLRADRWRDHPFWKPSFTHEDPEVRYSEGDERVPFILKLAGESEGLVYDPPFNTVLSHGLILAILSGDISKNESVVQWLNDHRSTE